MQIHSEIPLLMSLCPEALVCTSKNYLYDYDFTLGIQSKVQFLPLPHHLKMNCYVNFLGHLSSNGFQLKGRFGTHEILNIPISINVQDGINVQGGIFPQNQ